VKPPAIYPEKVNSRRMLCKNFYSTEFLIRVLNDNLSKMNTQLHNVLSDSYFRFLKSLDTTSKKQLIIKRTRSIDEPANESYNFSACFGAWDDERNAQQVFNAIRKDRVNARSPVDLL
jgi:hypothetical protein